MHWCQHWTLWYQTARQSKNQTVPFSPHSTETVENDGASRKLPETLEGGYWAHGTSDSHVQYGQGKKIYIFFFYSSMSQSKDSPAVWAGMRLSSSATLESSMEKPELSDRDPGGLPPFKDKHRVLSLAYKKPLWFVFLFFLAFSGRKRKKKNLQGLMVT